MSKLNNWLIKTTIFGKISKRTFVDEFENYYNNGKEYGNGVGDGMVMKMEKFMVGVVVMEIVKLPDLVVDIIPI